MLGPLYFTWAGLHMRPIVPVHRSGLQWEAEIADEGTAMAGDKVASEVFLVNFQKDERRQREGTWQTAIHVLWSALTWAPGSVLHLGDRKSEVNTVSAILSHMGMCSIYFSGFFAGKEEHRFMVCYILLCQLCVFFQHHFYVHIQIFVILVMSANQNQGFNHNSLNSFCQTTQRLTARRYTSLTEQSHLIFFWL